MKGTLFVWYWLKDWGELWPEDCFPSVLYFCACVCLCACLCVCFRLPGRAPEDGEMRKHRFRRPQQNWQVRKLRAGECVSFCVPPGSWGQDGQARKDRFRSPPPKDWQLQSFGRQKSAHRVAVFGTPPGPLSGKSTTFGFPKPRARWCEGTLAAKRVEMPREMVWGPRSLESEEVVVGGPHSYKTNRNGLQGVVV